MAEVDPQVEALWHAAGEGDLPKLRELLDSGVNVSALTECGWTALGNAAGGGHEDAVRFLLERGAPVDQVDESGSTALFCAAESGSMLIVEILRSAGADPLTTTAEGSAFTSACRGGHVEVVKHLLDLGADVGQISAKGYNALHSATLARPCPSEVLDLLIAKGVSVNDQNANGHTPLHIAARQGAVETVRTLLEAGADPNIKGGALDWKDLPVDLARERNREDVVEILAPVTGNADPGPDKPNPAALVNAAMVGNVDLANRLLAAGTDPSACAGDISPILYAALFSNYDVAKLLLEKGADPNFANSDGNTALHFAIIENSPEIARLLLAHGAKPDHVGEYENTPLHIACIQHEYTLIGLLLEAGANPDAINDVGHTPLHCALDDVEAASIRRKAGQEVEQVIQSSSELIRQFVKHKVRMDVLDEQVWTPLHVAIVSGDIIAVKELLAAGASTKIPATERCVLPIALARESRCPNIERLLASVENEGANNSGGALQSASDPSLPTKSKAGGKPGCMVIGALFVCAFGLTGAIHAGLPALSSRSLRASEIKHP